MAHMLNEMNNTSSGSIQRKQVVNNILDQLEQFPSKIYERYEVYGRKYTPIQCLSRAGEDTKTIRARLCIQPLNLEQSKCLSELCQGLESLSLEYRPGWDYDAFVHFVTALRDDPSLQSLTLKTLPDLSSAKATPEKKASVLTAFELFLAKNAHLTKLEIQLKEAEANSWHSWVEVLHKGMTKNTTIKQVCFDNWFKDSYQTCHTRLEISETGTHLCLGNFQPSNQKFVDRLDRFVPADSVTSLRLENGYAELAAGASIASFITRASSLQRLEIEDYHVDAKPILTALQKHPSIKVFNMKSNFNHGTVTNETLVACLLAVQQSVTLEQCSPWSQYSHRIQHHLNYNRFVRGRIGIQTTNSNLVDMLTTIQGSKVSGKLSTTFALLREMPGLWCTPPCSTNL